MLKKIVFIALLTATTLLNGYAQEYRATYQGEIGNQPFILYLDVNGSDAEGFYMYLADYKTVELAGKLDEGRISLNTKQKKPTVFEATLDGRHMQGTFRDAKKDKPTPFYATDLRGEYTTHSSEKYYLSLRITLGPKGYEIQRSGHESLPLGSRMQNDSIFIYTSNPDVEFIAQSDSSIHIPIHKTYTDAFAPLNRYEKGKILRLKHIDDFLEGASFIEFPEKDEDRQPAIETKVNDRYSMRFEPIRKSDYFLKLWESGYRKDEYKAITDIKQAKSMLKKQVQFRDWEDVPDPFSCIQDVKFKDGAYESLESEDYPVFVAYYPELDVLVAEGGHSSDYCIDLKNSKNTNPGNPIYYHTSPDKKLRINGRYNGQEGVDYFLEQWDEKEKVYKTLEDFSGAEYHGLSIYYVSDWFWYDNHTLLYKCDWSENAKYYELRIIRTDSPVGE